MSESKLRLREAVIVEGRYDRIRVKELISTPVIETGGFRVFKDKEKQRLISEIAERRGILILTDSDAAGFVIRNFLKGIIPEENIKNAYIPSVSGKEKRKAAPSKEGLLGVEGINPELLIKAIRKSGAHIIGEEEKSGSSEITASDFYDLGLSGQPYSKALRERILLSLGLPKYLSKKAMLDAVGCLFSKSEFEELIQHINDDPSRDG